MTGRVCQIPRENEDNFQYEVKVENLSYVTGDKKLDETVLMTSDKEFEYGDTVTFSGFLKDVPTKMNSTSVDYEKYYKSRNIFFKIYSDNAHIALYKINDYSPNALRLRAEAFISKVIDDNYKGDYAAILKAVITGNKREFSDGFDNVLTRTGLRRMYRSAYLQIMMFMAVLSFILGGVGKRKRDIVTVFLLIIYALFNADSAVFWKIAVLISVMMLMKFFVGRSYYVDTLGITVLIIGIANPLVFFDAGFAVSALSGLMVHYFLPTVYDKLSFIHIKYVRRMTAVGIICNIVMIPMSIYFFGETSLHPIFLSWIMVPCSAVIIAVSPLLIIMLALFHAAPVVRQVTDCMLFILKYLPILADKVDFLHISLPRPGILLLIIYACIIIALVKYVRQKKKQALIVVFVAAALAVPLTVHEIGRLNDVEITFVNVGQGDGALISAPHRFNILIDGGGGNNYSEYNPGEKMYLEYLKSKGITRVDSAFVSHYHKDHVQGIIAAIENLRVRNLFMPDNWEDSKARAQLEKTAKEHGTAVHYISEESILTYKNGMTIRAIPPAEKTEISDEENDTSYIYYVDYNGFTAMFTGDMTKYAERCLLEGGRVPKADLLKVAHHGSKTSTCEEWLDAVDPKYAVISVGENNEYSLPNDAVIERLSDTELYRTDYDGDIRFTIEANGEAEIDTFDRED